MKKYLFLIAISIFSLSCSSDDDGDGNDFSQIIGSWKLIEGKIFFGPDGENSVDYSGENILYNFSIDGKLVVTGGDNYGYPTGVYDYFFGEDYLGGNTDPLILLVKINNSKWTYDFSDGRMTLGQSYVDGPDLIFERK